MGRMWRIFGGGRRPKHGKAVFRLAPGVWRRFLRIGDPPEVPEEPRILSD